MPTVEQNYRRAVEQVAEAAEQCGRSAASIRIIGVSKYVDVDRTRELIQAGCTDIGESRPQNLWEKQGFLSNESPSLQWHMIGHLQRNKVAKTIAKIDWLHSLDSLRLAQAVHEEAAKRAKPCKILIEVNVTEDASKTGIPRAEVAPLVEQIVGLSGLSIRGLMAMSTEHASLDQARREFDSVRALSEELQQQYGSAVSLNELSMGMTNDFPAAIAAGATMLRLGSLLWQS